jgi:DNA-binding transcriptional MerR regulator
MEAEAMVARAEEVMAREARGRAAAMMAAVLDVPPAAIRHWIRSGLFIAARSVGSVDWFGFEQLVVGRHLARFLAGGLSLRDIDAKLRELVPGGGQAAADAASRVRLDGRRLSLDDGGRMLAAGGQLQLGFYTASLVETAADGEHPAVFELELAREASARPAAGDDAADLPPPGSDAAEILDLADDLEAAGEFVEAAEAHLGIFSRLGVNLLAG